MTELTATQKTEIRHAFEIEQANREEEREQLKLKLPRGRGAMRATFAYIKAIDVYLKSTEAHDGTNCALYCDAVTQRAVAVERFSEHHSALQAAEAKAAAAKAEIAAKIKASENASV